jgi:hypothetical protein
LPTFFGLSVRFLFHGKLLVLATKILGEEKKTYCLEEDWICVDLKNIRVFWVLFLFPMETTHPTDVDKTGVQETRA